MMRLTATLSRIATVVSLAFSTLFIASPSASAAQTPAPLPSLLSVLPVLPYPVTTDQYQTRYWIQNVPTWFEESYSYPVSWTVTYDTYSSTTRSATVFVDRARFLFDALSWSASAKNTALDELRTAINNGLSSVYAQNPSVYTFNVAFVGMTDPRCTESNYDGVPSGEPNLKLIVDKPCATLSSAAATDWGFNPNTGGRATATGYTRASEWLAAYDSRKGSTPYAAGWLGNKRAAEIADLLRNRYRDTQAGVWTNSILPYVTQISVGDWYTYHSAAKCNEATDPCKEERRAEVVVWYSYTATDTTTCYGCGSRTEYGTATAYTSVLRDVPTLFQEQVNCTYYNTCLPDTPGFSSSPIVQVPSYMQPNRTHTFALTPVTVSCSSCTPLPTSGPARSGWAAPQVLSATFSGFSAASISPPRGYSSPSAWEVKTTPSGYANQNQALAVTFKRATRAGESYRLTPGTVTITVSYTPWLWTGSSLTYIPDLARTETLTFPVSCKYTPTGSSSCSFKVLGTAIGS